MFYTCMCDVTHSSGCMHPSIYHRQRHFARWCAAHAEHILYSQKKLCGGNVCDRMSSKEHDLICSKESISILEYILQHYYILKRRYSVFSAVFCSANVNIFSKDVHTYIHAYIDRYKDAHKHEAISSHMITIKLSQFT